MAKTNLAPKLKNTTTLLKNKVSELNKELLPTSELLIEGLFDTGEKIQDILEKALKNGTTLLGKQQELTIETIEAILIQYKRSKGRLNKLVGFKKAAKKAVRPKRDKKKIVLSKKVKVVKKTPTIDELLENAFKEESSKN